MSLPLVVYLDACCFNRPFNDHSQDRLRLESEAIMLILGKVNDGQITLVGSEVLLYELRQTPDPARRLKMLMLCSTVRSSILLDDPVVERGKYLESVGFKDMDALHLACAEAAQVHYFLTVDDPLLRLATRLAAELKVQVKNPLHWLIEVTKQ